MAKYEETLTISKADSDMILYYLREEPWCEEEALGEEDTISNTVCFADGRQMDIKCCGVNYEEGESNTAWTEAVLFDKNGAQICCTEPAEDYLGDWELEADGNEYVVHVITK